jgi:tRNA-2-methylthio-N6-dimethylallyladenosine synthase
VLAAHPNSLSGLLAAGGEADNVQPAEEPAPA